MSVEISVLQLIAYVALTMASVTITAVSALFGYRQNFGWKPILLTTNHSLSGQGNVDLHQAIIDFEFWNRRKYPLVVRAIIVQFENMDLIKDNKSTIISNIEWHPYRNGYITRPGQRLEPASHSGFQARQGFKAGSLDSLKGKVSIELLYSDPLEAEEISITATRDYSFQFEVAKKPSYMRMIGLD